MKTKIQSGRRRLAGVAVATLGTVALVFAILATGVERQPQTESFEASHKKLDLALQPLATAGGDQRVRVIVSAFSGRAEDAGRAVLGSQADVIDRFESIGAVTTVVPAHQLAALAADWRVRNLSSDGLVESAQFTSQAAGGNGNGNSPGGDGTTKSSDSTTDTTNGVTDTAPTDGSSGGNWQTENLAEHHLRNTLGIDREPWDGNGVRIAVVDSGVEAWEEVWGQWKFRNGRNPSFNQSEFGTDPYGHGTHVAGLVVNSGWYSHGLYQGLARPPSY